LKPVVFSRHAAEQMVERGASRDEVLRAIAAGNAEPAKAGRTLFRLNFGYNAM